MEINVVENGVMQLNHVYNPISLISSNNEQILICMRDGGFEFRYNGVPYRAVGGVLAEIVPDQPKQSNEEEISCIPTQPEFIRGSNEAAEYLKNNAPYLQ